MSRPITSGSPLRTSADLAALPRWGVAALLCASACGSAADVPTASSDVAAAAVDAGGDEGGLWGDASMSCHTDADCPGGERCVVHVSGELAVGTCVVRDAVDAGRVREPRQDGGQDSGSVPSFDGGASRDASRDASPTCGPPVFGPEPARARGGQRVMDSHGYLYVTTYGLPGFLARVPPGGGTVEILKSGEELGGTSGWCGVPYVMDDDTLLVSTQLGIMRYDPVANTTTLMGAASTNVYGFSPIVDASGRVVATGKRPNLFQADWSSTQKPGFVTTYGAVHGGWFYRLGFDATGEIVEENCLDGEEHGGHTRTWSVPGPYGMAIGADGDIYVTQGNVPDPKVFRVPRAGGAVTPVVTIPTTAGATYLAADEPGFLYVAPAAAPPTVWRVDPAKGTRVVYGCSAGGRACGSTS